MRYRRPEIHGLAPAVDAIQHAQNKGLVTIVDSITWLIITFATPMAYECDE